MTRVCIIGGGTAGMAAAYALKDDPTIQLTIVEREATLGGTAVNAWVNTWIEGINPPYLQKLFQELKAQGLASGDLGNSWIAQNHRRDQLPSSPLIFDVKALAARYQKDMEQAGVTLYMGYQLKQTHFAYNSKKMRQVQKITVFQKHTLQEQNLEADFFIDCTGEGVLCRQVNPVENEDYFYGEDPQSRFQEPDAPKHPDLQRLNAPSLFYKIAKPASTPAKEYSHKPPYITGDGYNINGYEITGKTEDVVNPLAGEGLNASDILRDYDDSYQTACQRSAEHWAYVQSALKAYALAKKKPSHRDCEGFPPALYTYQFLQNAPMLGIRESYRIHCEYMLRQQDLLEKINAHNLKHYVACGGHTIDFHGIRNYNFTDFNSRITVSGIPYECLIPQKISNTLIASHAYGASHIALAARRINKDIAQLGWAAGHAIRICIAQGYADTRLVCQNIAELQEITQFKAGVEYIEQFMK